MHSRTMAYFRIADITTILLLLELCRCFNSEFIDNPKLIKSSGDIVPEYRFELISSEGPNNTITVHLKSDFTHRLTSDKTFRHNLKINITYHLLDVPYSASQAICLHPEKFLIKFDPPETFRNECRSTLFRFSRYNESDLDEDPLGLMPFCDKQARHFDIREDKDWNHIRIDRLLPNQHYMIDWTVSSRGVVLFSSQNVEPFCTRTSAPMYPPQSDFGSFHILPNDLTTEPYKASEHKVRLYWRPVPRLLLGSYKTSYGLACRHSVGKKVDVLRESILDYQRGHRDIIKPVNDSYICKILSENEVGVSGYTYISIPTTDHIIKLDEDFKFHVVNVAPRKYILKWSPFGSHERALGTFNLNNISLVEPDGGYYTIYWCYGVTIRGCEQLSGLVKTNHTGFELELPESDNNEYGLIRFGLSLWHERNRFTTGIVWAKCISLIDDSPTNLKLHLKASVSPGSDHPSIVLAWIFPHCEALGAVITTFSINYCPIDRVGPWSALLGAVPSNIKYLKYKADPSESLFHDESCLTMNIQNDFRHEATISNLTPSTGYMIRIRYTFVNGSFGLWSDSISVNTFYDPNEMQACIWTLSLCSLFAGLLLTCAFAMKFLRLFSRVRLMWSRYIQTKSTVTELISAIPSRDEINDVPRNFCRDRAAGYTRSDSDLSLRTLADDDSEEFKRALCSQYSYENTNPVITSTNSQEYHGPIIDYIPNSVLNGYNHSTPDRSTDSGKDLTRDDEHLSEVDDVSVTSHSSFLENILMSESIEQANNAKDKLDG